MSNVNVTGSGETLGVTATVRSSGDGTRCSVSVSGGSSATGSCDGTITVAVSMYNTSYTVTYTATNAVGSASHSVSATSGLKALTANATDAYGTCARYPQKFCGPDSDVEPGPTFTTSIGSVIGGTVMSLNCWTTGGIDYGNVPPYNAGTNVWVHVTNSPGPGYMSILWFPHPSSVTSGLPKC